jgi:hypothetical protein
MDGVKALAITNYDPGRGGQFGGPLTFRPQMHDPIQKMPLLNALGRDLRGAELPYQDFIFDTVEFDIHCVGKRDERTGAAAVLESVTGFKTENARFKEAHTEWLAECRQRREMPAKERKGRADWCTIL